MMARGLPKRKTLVGVKAVLLIASGKGGVGKSTTAVNVAVAMASKSGKMVSLLDADIYGPSLPLMMNLQGHQPLTTDQDQMVPLMNYGVKCMSVGFLLRKAQDALAWRGPMVMSAVQKLAFGTDWSETDVLVVDMPPGTGDIHLSIAQTLSVTGAVVVSTPQKVALGDARKAVSLFHSTEIPVVGLVENMGAFSCPKCGEETAVFGEGGVKKMAEDLMVPFLTSVPLEPEIMMSSDEGVPVVVSKPGSKSARSYFDLSQSILDFFEQRKNGAPG